MSNAWAYRATTAGARLKDTLALLLDEQFLCRTAFAQTADGIAQLIPNAGRIHPGDDLHMYYSEQGEIRWLGSFVVVAPQDGPADAKGRTPAIGLVNEGSALALRLEELGYARDPQLGRFTGIRLQLLDDGTEPPGAPRFVGRNSIGSFPPTAAASRPRSAPPAEAAGPLHDREIGGFPFVSATPPIVKAHAYGIDWSGGQKAGDKIWVATLDPARRSVIKVERPWRSVSSQDIAAAVASWLADLEAGWIALDAPFGVASSDRTELLGTGRSDPRDWSHKAVQRYADRWASLAAVSDRGLIGKHRRATDIERGAPFAPTLLQLIHQTYAAFQLLGRLDRDRVRILPWEHERDCPVTLLETCPAVLLKCLGLSNRGYKKLEPGSSALRRKLLSDALRLLGWRADEEVLLRVEQDVEGDALDSVLCALAASHAMSLEHASVARRPGALEEGWIYA